MADRSPEIDRKIQGGADVGLLAALFVALWFFGPAATIGVKGEWITASIQPQCAVVILPRHKEAIDNDPVAPHRVEDAIPPI